MATDLTFRDFATAVMGGKIDDAARVLEELLGLDPAAAASATARFEEQAKTVGPEFMMKAMGLRHAVTAPDDAPARELLADCFGLEGAALDAAIARLRGRSRAT